MTLPSKITPSTILRMENTLEKLKCLNYEEHFIKKSWQKPIGSAYFLVPDSNPKQQFKTFVLILKWLFSSIKDYFDDFQIEDSTLVLQSIIKELKSLKYEGSMSISKLKLGYGEEIILVLDFLTDLALSKANYMFLSATHDTNDVLEESNHIFLEGNEKDVEDFSEKALADEIKTNEVGSGSSMIVAKIDPVEWRTELERVGPKLRDAKIYQTGEWRYCVHKSEQLFQYLQNDSQDLESRLALMSEKISSIIEKVEAKESIINDTFSSLSEIYKTEKVALNEAHKSCDTLSETIGNLSKKLECISNDLIKVKKEMDAKANQMTDTSPLIQIKSGLQVLKADVKSLDLRIGVANHTLLKYKKLKTADKGKNVEYIEMEDN